MADISIGSTIAGYRIEALAGRGGMGVVYRATQLGLNRPVALKLIASDLAHDPAFRERFKHESEMAAAIDHPNVIPVYEAGEIDGLLFITIRYVDGTDLRALIAREGRLAPARAGDLVAQVAAALDAAHQRGLVHRDVKPANVLIAGSGPSEHVYLTDFGLTKRAAAQGGVTQTGQWVGTLDYVAPEQIEGRPADARADIYSLGGVLFEALTGRVPFPRDSDVAKIYAHLSDPRPAPSQLVGEVPRELDGVVQRALAREPADRYPSAGDLGRAAIAGARGTAVLQPERSVAAGEASPEGATAPAAAPPTVADPGARPTRPLSPSASPTEALPPSAPSTAPAPARRGPPREPAAPPAWASGQRPPERRRSRAPLAIAAVVLALLLGGGAVFAVMGPLSGDGSGTGEENGDDGDDDDRDGDGGSDGDSDDSSGGGGDGGGDDGGDGGGDGGSPVSQEEVEDLLRRYQAAYTAESVSGLAELLAPGLVRRDPPSPVQDRNAALNEYQRQFETLDSPVYTLQNVSVETGSGEAAARADYRVTAANADVATGLIAFHMVEDGGQLLIDEIEISN